MTENRKKIRVVIGGTFDVLHEGHKALLRKAFSLGEILLVGLTSNSLAEMSRKRKVRDFAARKKDLKSFIFREFKGAARIVKISDAFGPTLKENFNYLVVSPESYRNATLINRERKRRRKKPIRIVKIKFVLGKNGRRISATELISNLRNKDIKTT